MVRRGEDTGPLVDGDVDAPTGAIDRRGSCAPPGRTPAPMFCGSCFRLKAGTAAPSSGRPETRSASVDDSCAGGIPGLRALSNSAEGVITGYRIRRGGEVCGSALSLGADCDNAP